MGREDVNGKKRLGSTRDDKAEKVISRLVKHGVAKGTGTIYGETNVKFPNLGDKNRSI